MTRRSVRHVGLLAVLCSAPWIAAAEGPGSGDLAKRTFQNAEQLMQEGKADQALKAYQQVIQSFGDSALADDALLRVGAYHYPTATIDDLGKVPPAGQQAARAVFDQIRERYAQSDSAPEAFYRLGLLDLEPDSPGRNLDEAYANFYSVVNIYPDSDLVASALVGAARAEMEKRGYDRAILSLDRALEYAPHGPVAAQASYLTGIAEARLGDFARAAEALQACRNEDDRSAVAARALDWLTLVYNLRLKPAGAQSAPAHDASFVPRLPAGEDLRGELGLAVSPAGELLVADPKRGAVLAFADDGTKARSDAMAGARRVAIDAYGKTIVVSETEIRIDGEDFPAGRKAGANVRRIESPAGVWRTSTRDVIVLDTREGELLRFGADPADPKVLSRDKESGYRLEAMAGGPEDRVYLLDTRQKQILVLEAGKLSVFKRADAPPALEDPTDLAVDALGDVFVTDARLKCVFVLGPDGRRLAQIAAPAGSLAELVEPGALAVGPRGEVYVYDSRKRTVLRFR
ncbi:MAG: tetratricopeptide repeat protein [Acidobacteria bacterium]|nr:tetratricopeptide repeat protein [Acidobacteriota bacterium]